MSYRESFWRAMAEQPIRQPVRVAQALARHLGLRRRREAARLRAALRQGASVLPCSDLLRPARHKYAGHSGPWIEDGFFNYWVDACPATKLRYVPVFWTDIYLQLQTLRWPPFLEKRYRREIHSAIHQLVTPSECYFTVLEYDHMIWDWHQFPRNVIVFSAGGWGEVPVPLLMGSPRWECPPKDIRASFMGKLDGANDHNGLRSRMRDVMLEHAILGRGPQWRDIMRRSVFTLCPRGLGRASFRMYEALSVGSIPIYIWDDVEWLPWRDELDWSEFSLSVNVAELDTLPQRLAAISDGQILAMRQRISELYDDYFTLPGMCRQIHKRVEQLSDRVRFMEVMRSRPYLPGTIPPPVPEVG